MVGSLHPLPSIAECLRRPQQVKAWGEPGEHTTFKLFTIWWTGWKNRNMKQDHEAVAKWCWQKKICFCCAKEKCINLINPILFPHVQFVNYVVQRKNVEMTIIANIHSSPSSPPVETQVLSVAQGRLHCCVRRLACLEQLTQVVHWMCWGQITPHHPIRP